MKLDYTETEREQLERRMKERNRRDLVVILLFMAILGCLMAVLTEV